MSSQPHRRPGERRRRPGTTRGRWPPRHCRGKHHAGKVGGRKSMIAPLRRGVTLAQPNGPVIETERLRLRQWCGADIAPNTAMLADPGTARFITVDGKPVADEVTGWRNAAVMAGHWLLHGAGMS